MKRTILTTALAGVLALGVVSPAQAAQTCSKGTSTTTARTNPCRPHEGRTPPIAPMDCEDDTYAQPPYAVWVKKGDTLWSLAVRYLGNGHRYREIMARNHLKSTLIYPGMLLSVKSLPGGCLVSKHHPTY